MNLPCLDSDICTASSDAKWASDSVNDGVTSVDLMEIHFAQFSFSSPLIRAERKKKTIHIGRSIVTYDFRHPCHSNQRGGKQL